MSPPNEMVVSDKHKSLRLDVSDRTSLDLWAESITFAEFPVSHLTWIMKHLLADQNEEEALVYYFHVVDPTSSLISSSCAVTIADPAISNIVIPETEFIFSWISDQKTQTQHQQLTNATTKKARPDSIRIEFQELVKQARDEVFEDGMESHFSRKLMFFIREYGVDATDVLEEFICSERINAEIASETLRWVGHMYDLPTLQPRLWLLGRGLRCLSPRVRDAAALGLSFLGDSQACPTLQAAIEREEIPELREDMKQALAELKRVNPWVSS